METLDGESGHAVIQIDESGQNNIIICGGTYRCTLALRSYTASTEELALLRRLGEKSGVTLHIYNRRVSVAEEDKIIHNAEN